MRLGKRSATSLFLNLNEVANQDPSAFSSDGSAVASSDFQTGALNKKLRLKAPTKLNISSSVNGGCLSPSESPNLLANSLRLANELKKNNGDNNNAAARTPKGQIGSYLLLSPLDSAGFCYHALDTRTKQIKNCQLLSKKQYDHLMLVTARLNSATSADWAESDLEEMRKRILPSDSELVPQTGGWYFFFPRSYGSLHSFVQSRKKLNEQETKKFYAQIVRMVMFCHALGIVVRDLKLRKFVFDHEQQSELRLGSVMDLVVCAEVSNDQLTDRHGCPAYVSPEILNMKEKSYSGQASDMWSLGVLLFVMLLGRYPFYDKTPVGLFAKIRQGLFWIGPEEKLTMEAKCLLRGLLRRDWKERPTARELLAIPWFRTDTPRLPSGRPNSNCELTSTDSERSKTTQNTDDQVVPSASPYKTTLTTTT